MPWLVFEVAVGGLAWLGMGVLLATATAVVAVRLGLFPPPMRGAATMAALVGGAVVAAVLHRFGLEGPFALDIGSQTFPTTWVLAGAVVGVMVLAGLSRRPRRRRERYDDPPGRSTVQPAPINLASQTMDTIMSLLTDPATTHIAVVGASDSPGKWGGRAYRDLRAKGFQVRAVHPTAPTVADDPAFPTVADLPESPDVVVFVVPPPVTLSVLEECLRLGYTSVWVQPGAGDDAVRKYLDEHEFNAIVDACILVETA
jgi:hypothetical protein